MAEEEAVPTLLAQGREAADRLEWEAAVGLIRRAASLDPSSTAALDALAEVCLQVGETAEAQAALQRSVEISPEGGGGRYMYLGQLSEGAEALGWFERGVCALRVEREALEAKSGSREELQRLWLSATHALATALCAAAEVYLTDACDEEEAESKCEALATEAVQLVTSLDEQTLSEPYQTLASLRLSQQRPEEAERLLLKALSVCDSLEGTPQQPSLESRLALAKLLMEVGRAAEAAELLQLLRLEDDESLELWYLLACAAQQAGEVGLAQAELEQSIQFAESDACPVDEREWLPQLLDLQADVRAAAAEGGKSAH